MPPFKILITLTVTLLLFKTNSSSQTCFDCKTPIPPNSGLVACYPFQGSVQDASGNNYHGNMYGGTLIPDRFGRKGNAYTFNGTGNYMTASPNYPDLTRFSFSFWMKPSGNGSADGVIFWEGSSICGNDVAIIYRNNTISIIADKSGTTLNTHTVTPSEKLSIPSSLFNQWYHIVWTMDASQSKLYLNGNLAKTINIPGSGIGYHGTPTFGAFNDGHNTPCGSPIHDFFQGGLDDIRIYNRVLSAAEASLLYNNNITLAVIPMSDTTICYGDSVRLTASGGSSYTWDPVTELSNPNIADPYVKPISDQQYIVTITDGFCITKDSVKVHISNIVEAGPDQVVCIGDSVQLNASGSISYAWTQNGSLSDTTIPNPHCKPAATTTCYVMGSANGCKAWDSVKISVVTSLVVSAGSDVSICAGDSTLLLATGANSYTWNPGLSLSHTSISNPYAKPVVSTMYTVTGSAGGCSGIDSVWVTIKSTPQINPGPDTVKCANQPFIFSPSILNGDRYSWQPSSQVNDATILNAVSESRSPQLFTLTVTNSSTGCSAKATVFVDVRHPVAEFSVDTMISSAPPYTITPKNGSYPLPLHYNWEINDSVATSYPDKEPTHVFVSPGVYRISLMVQDEWGCIDSTFRQIVLFNGKALYIPNVFSPNGDGLNDVFEVHYTPGTVKEMKGTIWNRWGAKVYEFETPDLKWWNGKADEKYAVSDVYFYTIEVVDITHESRRYNGTVTLLR
jgi:gliding motility-associated-like protein